METPNFQLQDSVQLMHGFTPTMTISSINDENQTALCVWYDRVKKKINQEWLPLNVLKPTPTTEPLTREQVMNFVRR